MCKELPQVQKTLVLNNKPKGTLKYVIFVKGVDLVVLFYFTGEIKDRSFSLHL